MSSIRVEVVTGSAVLPWLNDLAALRIRVFREFPYLYDGSMAYERDYLAEYAESGHGLVVLALDQDRVIGCSTGLPLIEADAAFARPFVDGGQDVGSVFYFGESVLDADYRGRGLGHRFFDEREAHADRLGYPVTAFCAVVRSPDHPLRPEHHRPLDAFWHKRGYARVPELQARFGWKDIDQSEESLKTLVFWLRAAGLGR